MDKIWLIVWREYYTRVKKRSFIVLSILVPLLVTAMYAAVVYIVVTQKGAGDPKTVIVVDSSGVFKGKLTRSDGLTYLYSNRSPNELKKALVGSKDLLLVVPALRFDQEGIKVFSDKQPSLITIGKVTSALNAAAENKRLLDAGIDASVVAASRPSLNVESRLITEEGDRNGNSYASYGASLLFAMLIYLFIFLYGSQVMRGVIEEKTSRVLEILISSVRPFQLMMGKIIGIALVGLTQFLLWIILSVVITYSVSATMTLQTSSRVASQGQIHKLGKASKLGAQATLDSGGAATILHAIQTINFPYVLGWFLFYFITGYLLYGALFAAIGSAVDSETETQQFMLPVTLPLIFAFIISLNYVINFPDSPLSVWLSLIPLFSPVVMMVRIPFNPPLWQLATSAVLMVFGFLGTVWIAARIYRTGILMYGKKASIREMAKWLFYKE